MTRTARDRRAQLSSSARAAGLGLLVYAAARFAGAFLERYGFAANIVQLVIAEWGAGRLGIAWSDPLAPVPTTRSIAARALRGAGMGLSAALVGLAIVLMTKAATLAPNTPSALVSVVGILPPACLAVRDELLLHGLVLRVLPAGATGAARALKLASCGLVSAAAAFGDGAPMGPALLAEGLGGVALGALWLRDRGAWLPWGAHAAFAWATGTLARGGVLDLRAAAGNWGGGGAGLGAGWSAVVVATAICGGAIALGLLGKDAERG